MREPRDGSAPPPPRGVRDPVALRSRTNPRDIALLARGTPWTYADLDTAVSGAAALLRECGVRAGDRVGLLMRNSVEAVSTLHAAWRLGACVVPFDPRLTTAELTPLAQRARLRLLAAHARPTPHASTAALTQEIAGAAPVLEVPRTTRATAEDANRTPPSDSEADTADYEDADGRGQGRVVAPGRMDPAADALLLFTSGTTGSPKAARLTMRNLVASAAGSAERLRTTRRDGWLLTLPLHHVGGISILVRAALQGSRVVLHERFDVARVNACLDTGEADVVSVVPTMLKRILDARGDRPLPASTRFLVGGAAASASLVERACSSGAQVWTTYGLTEASSQVATGRARGPGTTPLAGHVGPPLARVRIRIRAEGGREAKPGEEGEILVSGPTVMTAYDDEEETNRAFEDAWLCTGDFGVVDAEGALRVLDRRVDLIVSGGENVYPLEVEAALLAHRDVADVVATGIPDADWGQAVACVVAPRVGGDLDVAELLAFARTRLAGYKIPRRVLVLPHAPRTALGKPDRREATKLLQATSPTYT